MPFIQRIVEPKYLSRTSLQNENGDLLVDDCELEAVTNNTLSNALRQLASLVLVANDIFTELTKELQKVSERSSALKLKIGLVEDQVAKYDPKKVPVPEGDISTFALLRKHYIQKQEMETGLFGVETRPTALRELYEAAAKTPVHAMRQMDRWRRDGHRSSRFFLCTPVLGAKRRKIRNRVDIDIETRMPALVGELRRWTSAEAIGDVTVTTDCINRITSNTTTTLEETDVTDTGAMSGDDEAIDHKLPSPEEQLQVLALKFPAEIVAVDVSGRRFDRMCVQRRSLLHTETTYEEEDASGGSTIRRRTRNRKPRGKRRNTLAGTDQKEIRDALTAGDATKSTELGEPDTSENNGAVVVRSKSTDLLRSKKGSPPDAKKSHFNTLKQWGKSRLKLINRSADSKSIQETSKIDDIDDINIYETVTVRRRKTEMKSTHERKTSYSSSEKSSSISLPISTPFSAAMNIAVKLRESSAQRRQRRNKDEQHSSSGNWSASSESGRASIGSEITSTTHPKSTSATTSNNSLNHGPPSSINSRRRFIINTSASSSVTSEGTLTPDIIHDIHDDGESSSVYSCDTEGYYTSFHMDSGLKTLKEEELGLPMTPLHTTSAFSNSSSNNTVLSAENEYELFGKGSTSTTTSSAGTVCTALRASDSSRSLIVGPAVPERISSLSILDADHSGSSSLERELSSDKTGTVKRSPANKATVVAVVHKQSGGDVSPDSGHNTSSSPIESVSSPNGAPSCSEFEFSESSDLEGVERIERIRIKTTINSSRIPSMCVITPQASDDETDYFPNKKSKNTKKDKSKNNNFNIPDLGSKNANRPKLNLPLQQPTETDLDTITFNSPKDCDQNGASAIKNKIQLINVNPASGYATVEMVDNTRNTIKRAPSPSGGCVIVKETLKETKTSPQPIFKATLMPLNSMFGKLKTNLSNLASSKKDKTAIKVMTPNNVENLFDSGDYVTIADVRNNNEKVPIPQETHYANDVGPQSPVVRQTEYISLNELPGKNQGHTTGGSSSNGAENNSLERIRRQGARVTLDAAGKVVYSSDSLKRRKGAHTTFEPGPFVKDMNSPVTSPLPIHRTPRTIRPVNSNQENKSAIDSAPSSRPITLPDPDPRPLSPQLNKVVIRANPKTSSGVTSPTADCVRMPPTTIVTPTVRPMSPKLPNTRGAYVHMQEDRGRPLSPAHEEERAHSSSNIQQMHPPTADRYYQRNYQEYHQPYVKDDGLMIERNSPLYKTLPSRMVYHNNDDQRAPDITQYKQYQENMYERQNYNKFNSLPRRQLQKQEITQFNTNLQQQQHPISVPQQFTNPVPFNTEGSSRNKPNFHYSTPNKDEPLGSKIPMGISNYFSPIQNNYEHHHQLAAKNESLKISPIDPRATGSFKSSTPAKLGAASNLTNKLLSPKKSTMTNEELYAILHKSKKKLNITSQDIDRASPVSSISSLSPGSSMKSLSGRSTPVKQPETGYIGEAKNRNSWSPNNDDIGIPIDPGSRQSWACSDRLGVKQTSRLDFKKLLLQHGTKTHIVQKATNKLSAVEQLKLSKSQSVVKQPPPMNILDLSSSPRNLVNRKFSNAPPPGSPKTPEKQRQVSKLLSPRSNWRFTNPRSDVLSSTILEDCREDESSHSSNERSSLSRKSLSYGTPSSIQNSIMKCNANVVADMNAHRPNNERTISRSQLIQNQRANFFKSPPPPERYSNTFIPKEGKPKSPSPPTLETAL